MIRCARAKGTRGKKNAFADWFVYMLNKIYCTGLKSQMSFATPIATAKSNIYVIQAPESVVASFLFFGLGLVSRYLGSKFVS